MQFCFSYPSHYVSLTTRLPKLGEPYSPANTIIMHSFWEQLTVKTINFAIFTSVYTFKINKVVRKVVAAPVILLISFFINYIHCIRRVEVKRSSKLLETSIVIVTATWCIGSNTTSSGISVGLKEKIQQKPKTEWIL